jgi:hypothetical protein
VGKNQFRRSELGHSPCRSSSAPRNVTVLDPHPPTGWARRCRGPARDPTTREAIGAASGDG